MSAKARERQLFASKRALANAQRIIALLVLREGGRIRIDRDEFLRMPPHATFSARLDEEHGCMVLEAVEAEPGDGEPAGEVAG